MTTPLLPLQQLDVGTDFEQWWRSEFHRLSVGAGTKDCRAEQRAIDRSLPSRRYLECRSFKLERRTITLGQLFPGSKFVSSARCFLLLSRRSKPLHANFVRSCLSARCRRLDATRVSPP